MNQSRTFCSFQILHLSHHNINSQTRVNIKQALWVHMKGKRLLGQKNSSFSSSNIEFSDQQYTYIQFYLISLMQPLFYSQGSAFKTTIQSEKELQQTNFSRDLFILAAISEQFLLTQHLIQSQFRLSEELKKEKQSSDSGQSSLLGNNNLIHRQSPEDEEDFKFLQEKQNDESPERKSLKKQGPISRLRVKKVFKYDVDSDSEAEKKQSKKCETKNIIKNFVKSIFNFMRKHKNFVIQILEEHKIAQNNFYSYIEEQNGKINTILELRQFWTQNPYSNICRIISCYFLRKYSLKHIFHSRISNHQVHLKYRQKLMRSLRNPKEFSSLKDF